MYHIIINPASRSGKGIKIWKEQIEPMLYKEEISFKAYFSNQAGEVSQIVRDICENTSKDDPSLFLIILGGDGTLNEALQGMDPNLPITLGYIPTGSSNDFARDLGIPKNPVAALDLILHSGKVYTMDTGTITYSDGSKRRFVGSSGIGYDAAVCEEILHSRMKSFFNKIGLGKLTYLGIALKQLFATKASACTLTLDDNPPISISRMLFVASMVHRYEGGGFMFCPNADSSDGILDLCVVGDLPKLLILMALPTAFYGKHYIFKGITAYKASCVKIETSTPLWTHTDGEVGPKTTSFTVQCDSRTLNIIAP